MEKKSVFYTKAKSVVVLFAHRWITKDSRLWPQLLLTLIYRIKGTHNTTIWYLNSASAARVFMPFSMTQRKITFWHWGLWLERGVDCHFVGNFKSLTVSWLWGNYEYNWVWYQKMAQEQNCGSPFEELVYRQSFGAFRNDPRRSERMVKHTSPCLSFQTILIVSLDIVHSAIQWII